MKKALLTVSLLLFFSTSAYGWEIAVGPSYQDLEISGKVKSDGTEIDVGSDLGLSDDEPIGVNVRLEGERHHLIFDFACVEFSGVKTLTRTIQFKNKTYNISTSVEGTVKYDLYEAQYHYDLLDFKGENWAVSLSPLLKVNVYDADLNIKDAGQDETYSETLSLPTAGAIGQINITKYLSLLAQFSGIKYSGDDYIEYKGIVRIKPIKCLNLDVGYKGMELDYSDSNDLLDLDIKGFFLQGSFVYKF